MGKRKRTASECSTGAPSAKRSAVAGGADNTAQSVDVKPSESVEQQIEVNMANTDVYIIAHPDHFGVPSLYEAAAHLRFDEMQSAADEPVTRENAGRPVGDEFLLKLARRDADGQKLDKRVSRLRAQWHRPMGDESTIVMHTSTEGGSRRSKRLEQVALPVRGMLNVAVDMEAFSGDHIYQVQQCTLKGQLDAAKVLATDHKLWNTMETVGVLAEDKAVKGMELVETRRALPTKPASVSLIQRMKPIGVCARRWEIERRRQASTTRRRRMSSTVVSIEATHENTDGTPVRSKKKHKRKRNHSHTVDLPVINEAVNE